MSMVPVTGTRLIDAAPYEPVVVDPIPASGPSSVGLFTRGGPPADSSAKPGWEGKYLPGNYVPGFVCNVYWKDLQPTGPTDEIPATTALNTAITSAAAKGISQVKVRFFAGIHAPEWAMDLGGGRIVDYYEPQGNKFEVIPRFWDPEFAAAQAACMQKLVARYGQNPLFVEWAICGPMVTYAEPFIIHVMNSSDPAETAPLQANRDKLIAAGYTMELHEQAYSTAIQSHAGLLGSSTMAVNPMQQVNPDATPTQSVAKSLAVIEEIADTLGPFNGAGNNSIRHQPPSWDATIDKYPTNLGLVYARLEQIANLEPRRPTYWQTATAARVGNLYEVCMSVVRMGGQMIELPDQYTDTLNPWGLTPAQMDTINNGLRANAGIVVETIPALVEDLADPGVYNRDTAQVVEDPTDPGTYIINSGMVEDPADPGTYLIN